MFPKPSLSLFRYTLIWFRPISPLNYSIPDALKDYTFKAIHHYPIDTLSPIDIHHLSLDNQYNLTHAPRWILSSPTAAYSSGVWAKQLSLPQRDTLAVMGKATQTAWLDAGGLPPKQWFISPTGESMGLLSFLQQNKLSIALLRTTTGRNDLFDALNQVNVHTYAIACYTKKDLSYTVANNIIDLFNNKDNNNNLLCFTSTDQPKRLINAIKSHYRFDILTILFNCVIWTSHQRIKDECIYLGFKYIL